MNISDSIYLSCQMLFWLMLWQLSIKDFIPVNMQMHSADNHNMPILGVVILRLSGRDQLGNERTTRQIICIANGTDKLFLSRGNV